MDKLTARPYEMHGCHVMAIEEMQHKAAESEAQWVAWLERMALLNPED